jgi:membrane-associated protein
MRSFPRQLARLALFLILFACFAQFACADDASAQPEAGFWATLFRNLLKFPPDTHALMELLGRPAFAVPAFLAINLIVFVETGLLVGFFLPGDSLLVTAGLIAASPLCGWNLGLLIVTVCVSAIVGDSIGYSIGYKTGPMIFNREKSFFFKKDHLIAAQAFYEKHGGKTIILARFMPILRTFAPVVAGVGKMEYRRFLAYNVFGGIGWVTSMILIGYFLPAALNPIFRIWFGDTFRVEHHVEKVVILVVFISIAPGIYVWLRSKLGSKTASPQEMAV